MKKILICLSIIICAVIFSASKFDVCNKIIVIHASPNSFGKFCGPTSGTFTTDSTGTKTLTGMCNGTYTICIDTTIGTVNTSIPDEDGYYDYVTNGNNLHSPLPCPCD